MWLLIRNLIKTKMNQPHTRACLFGFVYNDGEEHSMALHMKTKEELEQEQLAREESQQLEQELRAHPMVAARLSHKRDMFAADALVKNYVWDVPLADQGWAGTGTARQIRSVYDQLTKKKKKQ